MGVSAYNPNLTRVPFSGALLHMAAGFTPAGAIVFDTELYDTGNNAAAGIYTVPSSGYYRVTTHLNIFTNSGSTPVGLECRVLVNGATAAIGWNNTNGSGRDGTALVSRVFNLTQGDTIQPWGAFTAGGPSCRGGVTESYFSVEKL